MSEENNKKKLTIIITSVLLLVVIGVSYAYFRTKSTSTTKTVTSGTLAITYQENTGNSIIVNNIVPIYDSEISTKANKIAFSVKNNGTLKSYADISITNITMDTELSNLEFKWALYETDSNYSSIGAKISNGNFRNVTDSKQLLTKNIELNANTKKYYSLYIWVRETDLNQNNLMNKSFSGQILVEGSQNKGIDLLSTIIKNNNSPIVTTTPNFSTTATTDEGLIQGVDEDGETYYFRGAVEDNYVKIDGLKWSNTDDYHTSGEDMLWRIVRINGDGTIRLIADGSIGSNVFNIISNNEKYVGYTYDNSEPNVQDGTDSTIKTYLDTWYNTNMTNYDKYIANTRFCNDTTVTSTSGNTIYYEARNRLYVNKAPSFRYENTTKTYGGEYDLKVGLISADEVSFAGGFGYSDNTDFYIALKSSNFWTASAYTFGGSANICSVDNNGNMRNSVSNAGVVVRPTINLKSDILYTSGDGTKSNPYIIKSD